MSDYRVVYLDAVKRQMAQLVALAVAEGRDEQLAAAVRAIIQRL